PSSGSPSGRRSARSFRGRCSRCWWSPDSPSTPACAAYDSRQPMNTFTHDLICAVRALRKAPGFAAIAIATLAIGIGANSAIVSVIDNLLFRPPRFRHVDRLVYIFETNAEKVPPGVEPPPSPGNVLDWRERMRGFDAIAMWRNWYFSIRDAG